MTSMEMEVSRILLASLALIASLVMYWQMCSTGTWLRKTGRAIAAVGWMVFAWIWWWRILHGYEIIIHPVAQIAITLIAAGTILIYVIRHK